MTAACRRRSAPRPARPGPLRLPGPRRPPRIPPASRRSQRPAETARRRARPGSGPAPQARLPQPGCLRTGQLAHGAAHPPRTAPRPAAAAGPPAAAGRPGAGQGAFQPVLSLGQQPAADPELPERLGQPRPGRVAAGQGPFQRRAEIVLLARQHRQPAFPLRQAQERGRVPVPGRVGAAGFGEPVRRVVAHRVQQPVPGPVLGRFGAPPATCRPAGRSLPARRPGPRQLHTSAACARPKVPANTDSSPRTRRSPASSRS